MPDRGLDSGPTTGGGPPGHRTAGGAVRRAAAEAEREELLQKIVAYVDRERAMTTRLVERSALLELAPDPIFARDAQRRITYWNRAAEQVYGFTAAEAMERHPGDLLGTVYPIPLEEIERHVKETGFWEGDLVQTTKDGRRVTVASRWGAVFDDSGDLVTLLEVNRDMTERLEAQAARELAQTQAERERLSARLVRAQRLESLGQLAGGVAHDFNNLLAVISGYATMAARRAARLQAGGAGPAAEELGNDLAQITMAAKRAAKLTHQLLAFARQDAVQAEVIDVNATISEMLQLLTRTLGSHVELATELAPGLPGVRIDGGQLGQVLVNLAVNSRDAMTGGGRLAIETSLAVLTAERPLSHGVLPPGSYVRIRVNDTGAGMSREVVERAFDPFFTTRDAGQGTGLGLATVYGIVTQVHGQAEIYSEPGQGTTVAIMLPATTDPVTAPAADRAPAGEPPQTATVLIVEDEPALRALTATFVAEAGYDALVAGGGEEALALAASTEGPIDLLLTDVVMPGMLGQELAERLLAGRPTVKVLFISGFARPFLPDPGRSLPGMFLQKPFSDAELAAAIETCLHEDRPGDAE